MRSCLAIATLVFLGVLTACGTTSTLQTCVPACGVGDYCGTDFVCHPNQGAVDAGCTSDSQCGNEVCQASTRNCVPSDCSPACPSFETCSKRTCELNAGRCNSASDCPSNLPICDASNTCVAPQTNQPATLTYAALIVTNQDYLADFQQLAQLHTLTGVPTKVVTVESICAAAGAGACSQSDKCNDTPKAIKDYLIAQHAQGITQVVLGGGEQQVPSRWTHSIFNYLSILGFDYDEQFYSDYYYSDVSEWDTNHDCLYGEPTTDTPTYLPTLGVTRVSVSSHAEIQTYIGKAQAYLTAYDTTRLNKALFLSNVAAELQVPRTSIIIPIDSALYFEAPQRTLSLMPSTFTNSKLYSNLGSWPGAQPLTIESETTAFEAGYNIAIHSGHGGEDDITVEQDGTNDYTGEMAYALHNSQYPLLLSCACEAATFADGDACAGQQFITSPTGGGIGYLGNSTIGLGIAGGMQMLDGFLRYAFSKTNPLIGEALIAGHANLPHQDGINIPNIPIIGSYYLSVMDPTSWVWTQKAVTYLGDGLLPVYTNATMSHAPSFTAHRATLGNFTSVTFTPSAAAMGTLAVELNNNIYELPITSQTPVTLTIAGTATTLTYGFSSATTLSAYQQITLP